ncbi:hypothetical protein AB9X29_003709 [Vibrio vulnificus]
MVTQSIFQLSLLGSLKDTLIYLASNGLTQSREYEVIDGDIFVNCSPNDRFGKEILSRDEMEQLVFPLMIRSASKLEKGTHRINVVYDLESIFDVGSFRIFFADWPFTVGERVRIRRLELPIVIKHDDREDTCLEFRLDGVVNSINVARENLFRLLGR